MNSHSKAAAFDRLRRFGLPHPPSLNTHLGDHPALKSFLATHGDWETWYLRLPREVAPEIGRRIFSSSDLLAYVRSVSTSLSHLPVTLTGFVDPAYSGALLTGRRQSLAEFTTGALEGLLRLGEPPGRLSLPRDGLAESTHTPAPSHTHYTWSPNGLAESHQEKPVPLPEKIAALLETAHEKVEEDHLLEWLSDASGQLHFIDAKHFAHNYLDMDPRLLALQVRRGLVFTSDSPVTGLLNCQVKGKPSILLRATTILPQHRALIERSSHNWAIFRQGAVLSHYSTDLLQRGTQILISPEVYRFLASKKASPALSYQSPLALYQDATRI